MATQELTIRVDSEAAAIYRNADERQRQRYDTLLSFKLRSLAREGNHAENVEKLLNTMDEIGAEAQRRGLTPQVLESILNESP